MRKRLVLLGMIFILAGCSKTDKPVDTVEGIRDVDRIEDIWEESGEEAIIMEGIEQESDAAKQQSSEEGDKLPNYEAADSDDRIFSVNGKEKDLTEEEWSKVLTAWSDLQKEEPALPREKGRSNESIVLCLGEEEHLIRLIEDKNNTYVSLDDRVEYPYTDSMRELFETYLREEAESAYESTNENPEKTLIGLSVICEEPENQDEYLDTARAVVKPWLDSLQKRTDEYKLPSYTFTDRLAENREFHGDGMINGGREFVCYVAFDTLTEEVDTVFFAEGTYDTFYHYYFGPGILARFRWEDGVCTLTDYDEAFAMLTSDRLKEGLYGISKEEPEYKTFYDFLNDKENVENWLEQGYRSRLCAYRVSHNAMMLSNGKVMFMDIGDSSSPEYEGDMVTSDMNQYYYDTEGDEKYSSPVDFIDGQGAVIMTYQDGFRVVFDDYNHDGNPDFTIRISSDEYGSTYDVRCMDVNGTPWEDNKEIYVQGAFEESIRLQLYSGNSIYKPIDDGKGGITFQEQVLFGDKSNAIHPVITEEDFDDYRMYSQKFYLPEELRYYNTENEEVICYFWNNTGKDVTLQDGYEIQKKNGETWESIGTGTVEAVTAKSYGCVEIAFDIRNLSSQEMALYRIKVYAGDEPVYGGFYYGTEENGGLDIKAAQQPDCTASLCFELTNTGMSAIYPSAAVLYFGEKRLCDVNIDRVKRLNGGESAMLEVTKQDAKGNFGAGEYRLEVTIGGATFAGTAEVVAVSPGERYYFSERVEATKRVDTICLLLTNQIWNRENAVIAGIGDVEVLKDGLWYSTLLSWEGVDAYAEELIVPFGETVSVDLKDGVAQEELRRFFEGLQSEEYEYIEEEEYQQIMSMTFEEFTRDMLNIMQPQAGDLCRAQIRYSGSGNGSEYVYFERP